MTTYSNFDTQIQIEEFEPTDADLAEVSAWLEGVDTDLSEYDM
jgi:hypothetical protein